MTEPNIKLVRDLPLGILIILMGIMLIYFSWYESNFAQWFDYCMIILFAYFARIVIAIGYYLVRGLHIDVS